MSDGQNAASAIRFPAASDPTRSMLSAWFVLRWLAIALQFGVVILLIRAFQIESRALLLLMVLAFGGFAVHSVLPLAWRLPFFGLLSVAGFMMTVGWQITAILLVFAFSLVGVARLPISFGGRVAALLAVTGVLAVLRAGLIDSPVPGAIWPILGSMMMFRMIVYVVDLRAGNVPRSFWHALGYFFMLPNICFILFPVVDYKAFCKQHYNSPEFGVYQTGVIWMLRGVIHLLISRFLEQNLLVEPATVTNLGDAAVFAVSTYLLYLRVSGSFHLIVGLLHLFGFNLGEANHRFLLASSFTDFWRRINIYWKDFVQKVLFNPMYMTFSRRMKSMPAMLLATMLAFIISWLLHSYQWFWIRGEFPLRWQDAVYWNSLAILVCVNVVLQSRKGRSLKKKARTLRDDLSVAGKTIGMFVFICSTWLFWSAENGDELLIVTEAATHASLGDVLGVVGALALLGVVAVLFDRFGKARPAGRADAPFWGPAVRNTLIGGVLVFCGKYPGSLSFAPEVAEMFDRLRDPDILSGRDASVMRRGYYEDVGDTERIGGALGDLFRGRPADWNKNPTVRLRDAYPPYELIPGKVGQNKGVTVTINSAGMRDREYDQAKPAGSTRIAVLGDSHPFGSGVQNHETFENLMEGDLNERLGKPGAGWEVLNFSVNGYGPIGKLWTLQNRALKFEPDVILYFVTDDEAFVVTEVETIVKRRFAPPYETLGRLMQAADINKDTPRVLARNRANRIQADLLRWIYADLKATCEEGQKQLFFVFIPTPDENPTARQHRREQIAIAQEIGIETIDLTHAYDGVEDWLDIVIQPWDFHPTVDGHRMLADALYEQLVPLLKR